MSLASSKTRCQLANYYRKRLEEDGVQPNPFQPVKLKSSCGGGFSNRRTASRNSTPDQDGIQGGIPSDLITKDELLKVFKKSRKDRGYLCDCEYGSPRPGVIVASLKLHHRNCPMRRKILANTIELRGVP